ncbi:hypothetical protein GC098_28705 [Paenibacillus sp. LMG 31458]|uniref:Transposase n=1 Tax=Paenibacillus phytorum TaxID=2654977 RepID=A0ABX1Y635_9BACL|nr:hypothetical protein [Paenibacillus phytorum]NOU75319.1 hypothetical protein [Paenibacillus phytorum]
MENLVDLFPLEHAEVTEKGILFNGLIYSCSIAIREQWYLKDFQEIPIYIDNYDNDYIFVLLNDDSLTIAYRILENKSLDEQGIKDYQERIRFLKQQLKMRKKRR